MKNKPALLITATAIIVLAVLLMAANHLQDLEGEAEALGNDSVEEIDLRRDITSLESRLTHLEHQIPRVDLEQSIQRANMELSYVEDLLNKAMEIETVFGRITGCDTTEGILLEVALLGTEETIEISLADNSTQYMVTEITWAPISTEDFIEFLHEAEEDSEELFTFKMIDGKAVQIFQGEKRE